MADIEPVGSVPNRPNGDQLRSISDLMANFDYITNHTDSVLIPAIPEEGSDQGFADLLQPGVTTDGNFALTRDSSSQVTIAAGTVWVTTAESVFRRFTVSSSTPLSGIPAATNTRLDRIVFDSADETVKRLSGADQVGVTLDNETGAPTVAAGREVLYTLLVNSSGVAAAEGTGWRDRRKHARGAKYLYRRNNAANYATASAVYAAVDSTNMKPRLETGTSKVKVEVHGVLGETGGSTATATFDLWVDGAQYNEERVASLNSGVALPLDLGWEVDVSAGSHTFELRWKATGSISLVTTGATRGLTFTAEENTKPSSDNGVGV